VGSTLIRAAAIGVHHTATEDSAWDGPAAEAAMPNNAATLHYCFAWEDEAGSDVKEDYKFPHHRTKGGPANIPACHNGLSRLENSSIPDGDKAGVRAHLQAHIADHNKKSGDSADNAVQQFLARRREQLKATAKATTGSRPWYSIQARASEPDVVDVMITGEIGWDVDSGVFARALAAPDVANAKTLNVSLNSIGGDVFDGIGIYNGLANHPGRIVMTVTGLAASIASVIMMAGDEIIMGRGSEVMIHDAHAVQIGNAADMAKMAEILDRTSDNIATFYAERAGGTPKEWREIMRAEKWYNAQEAVDAGLADKVAPPKERVSVDSSAITLVARDRRRPAAVAQALNDAVTSDDGQNDSNEDASLTGFLAGLTDELRDEFASAPQEPTLTSLGDDIRAAVAWAATNVAEPQTTPVSDSLPELTRDHLADIRRAVQGE